MLSFRTIAFLGLAIGLATASPAAAQSGPGPEKAGPRAHAAGGEVAPPVFPSIVNVRLVRTQAALDRATENADDAAPDKAVAALKAVQTNMTKAWTAAKFVIENAPPAPPAEAGAVGHASGTGGGGSAVASPEETGFAVITLQHTVATTAIGLLDGADGALLTSVTDTLSAALDGRDAAIADIHAIAPPPAPPVAGDDRVGAHTSGAPVAAGWETLMPTAIPMLDDELQQVEGTQATGADSLSPAASTALDKADLQVTRTERTINRFWPPLPAAD